MADREVDGPDETTGASGRFTLPTLESWTREEQWGELAVRVGADVASCARVEALLDQPGFLSYAFTGEERDYCERRSDPACHFAARWAAKESFLKLLDEDDPVLDLTTVEVRRRGHRPILALGDPARERLAASIRAAGGDLSRAAWDVSLSHDETSGVALADVVLVFQRAADASEAGAARK